MNNLDNYNSGVNTVILLVILGLVIFGLVWFFRGGLEEQKQEGLNVELNLPAAQKTEATEE